MRKTRQDCEHSPGALGFTSPARRVIITESCPLTSCKAVFGSAVASQVNLPTVSSLFLATIQSPRSSESSAWISAISPGDPLPRTSTRTWRIAVSNIVSARLDGIGASARCDRNAFIALRSCVAGDAVVDMGLSMGRKVSGRSQGEFVGVVDTEGRAGAALIDASSSIGASRSGASLLHPCDESAQTPVQHAMGDRGSTTGRSRRSPI